MYICLKFTFLHNNYLFKQLPNCDNALDDLFCLQSEFYGKVVVGSPGKSFNVAFDTTWSYSWLMSSQCELEVNVGCWFHNQYNHLRSSTYKPDGTKFKMDLGVYNLTGFFSNDTFSVRPKCS